MANTVNFRTMNTESYQMCYAFAVARYLEAAEDLRHKDVMKVLKQKRDGIVSLRQENRLLGCSLDESVNQNSLLEIENQIRAEDFKHMTILKPIKSAMEESYKVIPDGLFDAYKLKFDGKNADFVELIDKFLVAIGLTWDKKGVVRKTADRIALMMGARIATSKTIVNNGDFVQTMKKQQFNKLFMSGFVDTLVKSGFKFDIPDKTKTVELAESKEV